MSLIKLGFDSEYFLSGEDVPPGFSVARVVTVNKDSYQISTGTVVVRAELSGKMLFDTESSMDLPAVGDWVLYQDIDGSDFYPIHKLLPRKSLLKRKTSGKKVDYQLIAANIDIAFIVMALDDNYNLNRLERYLVLVTGSGIHPVVLLTKSDLINEPELQEKISEINIRQKSVEVLALSNISGSGLQAVKDQISEGKTYCLLGSSGVGKTSLLNNLTDGGFAVKAVREGDSRGRHTTTRRELIVLSSGGVIIDTPGMRELGNFGSEEGLINTFDDITSLAGECRFRDCTHVNEKGCAVLAAVDSGEISEKQYKNYIKLRKEVAHYETSYHEKRKKGKEFSKFVKNVLSEHKKRKY